MFITWVCESKYVSMEIYLIFGRILGFRVYGYEFWGFLFWTRYDDSWFEIVLEIMFKMVCFRIFGRFGFGIRFGRVYWFCRVMLVLPMLVLPSDVKWLMIWEYLRQVIDGSEFGKEKNDTCFVRIIFRFHYGNEIRLVQGMRVSDFIVRNIFGLYDY